jgi:hypothetical protein
MRGHEDAFLTRSQWEAPGADQGTRRTGAAPTAAAHRQALPDKSARHLCVAGVDTRTYRTYLGAVSLGRPLINNG